MSTYKKNKIKEAEERYIAIATYMFIAGCVLFTVGMTLVVLTR